MSSKYYFWKISDLEELKQSNTPHPLGLCQPLRYQEETNSYSISIAGML